MESLVQERRCHGCFRRNGSHALTCQALQNPPTADRHAALPAGSSSPTIFGCLPAFDHGHLLRNTLEELDNAPTGQLNDQDPFVNIQTSHFHAVFDLVELSVCKWRRRM